MTDILFYLRYVLIGLAVVGLVLDISGTVLTAGDLQFIRDTKVDGTRRYIAVGNLRTQALHAMIQLLYLLVGIGFVILPYEIRPPPMAMLIEFGIFLSEMTLVIMAILAKVDRSTLIELVEIHEIEQAKMDALTSENTRMLTAQTAIIAGETARTAENTTQIAIDTKRIADKGDPMIPNIAALEDKVAAGTITTAEEQERQRLTMAALIVPADKDIPKADQRETG